MFDDEELARADMVGRAIHDIIGALAAQSMDPGPAVMMAAVTRALRAYRPVEARAHRQKIAAHVSAYFRHLLPGTPWRFVGRELALGVGRVDLVWQRADGTVLLDELKTGSPRQLETSQTRAQVAAYLGCALAIWPDRLCGLRLLSTAEPTRSLFITPDGSAQQIRATAQMRRTS